MQEATRPEIALLVRRQNARAFLMIFVHLLFAVVLFYMTLVFAVGFLFTTGFFDFADIFMPGRIWTYSHIFAVGVIPIGLAVRAIQRWRSPFDHRFVGDATPLPPKGAATPGGLMQGVLAFFIFHIVLGVSEQLGKAWGSLRRIVSLTPKEQKTGQRILEWLRKQGVPPRFHNVSRVKMDPGVVSKLARAGIVWYKIEDDAPMLGLNRAFDPPSPDEDDTE